MNKAEVAEIKKRYKKDQASFTRIAACYVNDKKEKVCTLNEPFFQLEEDEVFKYLEIASKCLSGKLNDNLMNIEFPMEEEEDGGKQQSLMLLRNSELTDDGMLDLYYDHIIESYEKEGNFLIVTFYDKVDVIKKTEDMENLDESEEVYRYLLSAVCPVELSKPGLGYINTENKIGARHRDWVVGAPETAIMFPSFTGRTTNIHEALVYSKDPKEPHREFFASVLGCDPSMTASEQKTLFHAAIANTFKGNGDDLKDTLSDIQFKLSELQDERKAEMGEDAVLPMTDDVLKEMMTDVTIPYEERDEIVEAVSEAFEDKTFFAEDLIDTALARKGEIRSDKRVLQEALGEKTRELSMLKEGREDTISVSVKDPASVRKEVVEGVEYLMIPVGDNKVYINGKFEI